MNYLDEVEEDLRQHLNRDYVLCWAERPKSWDQWQEKVVCLVREAVLKSYHNGRSAAKSGRKASSSSASACTKAVPRQ